MNIQASIFLCNLRSALDNSGSGILRTQVYVNVGGGPVTSLLAMGVRFWQFPASERDEPKEASGRWQEAVKTAIRAMKAWLNERARHLKLWPGIDEKRAETAWIGDAFETPLGAYYQSDHRSRPGQ